MDKFLQATTNELYFRDPAVDPPPKTTSMLLLNPGGVCIIGVWTDDCIGWCPKPKIPPTLKVKMSKSMKPAAWRIFRNNRWTYADAPNNRSEERLLWQPLYTDIDMQAEFERGKQYERDLQAKESNK